MGKIIDVGHDEISFDKIGGIDISGGPNIHLWEYDSVLARTRWYKRMVKSGQIKPVQTKKAIKERLDNSKYLI